MQAKRLYSDVVQGLSNKSSSVRSKLLEAASTSNSKTSVLTDTPVTTPRSVVQTTCLPLEDYEQLLQLNRAKQKTAEVNSLFAATQNTSKETYKSQQSPMTSNAQKQSQSQMKFPQNSTSNPTNYCLSTLLDGSSTCDLYAYNSYANSNFYASNPCQYSNCYPNNQSHNAFIPFTNYANQMPTASHLNCNQTRPNLNQNTIQFSNQAHNYYLNQCTRNLYLTPQPYFIIQQSLPKSPQRWTQQQQQQHAQQSIRSNTPQTLPAQQSCQYWNVTNQNSNQQLFTPYHHQSYETGTGDLRQRNKMKKFVSSKIGSSKSADYEIRNVKQLGSTAKRASLGESSIIGGKSVFVNSNFEDHASDYKLFTRKETLSAVKGTHSTKLLNANRILIVHN